jgi:CitMHS family citrate-Mg2+:H+ or citrate-Ca2+:H+ symporter
VPVPPESAALTLLAYGMVVTFMALIMTRRLSPLTALVLVPVAFALLGGFRAELGPMMLEGISKLAPTGVMLLFAILYFAIMIDAGLFEPFVARVVRLVQGDPVRVVAGSALLALLVSLDGDGSTTYMITTAAMLPLYHRLGVRPLVLACVTMLASGVMNLLPWGGPTARAASALGVPVDAVFLPMIPAMVVGALWVLFVAWRLGVAERARLAGATVGGAHGAAVASADSVMPPAAEGGTAIPTHATGWRAVANVALTALLLAALVLALLPLPVLFLLAFAVALVVNHPTLAAQKALLHRHAGNVLAVVGLIFAAGAFVGILSGTKMVDAMAASVVALVPPALGPYLAPVTGVLSVPFTFFISNDAFYFGVLPVLAKAGAAYGISAEAMARASLVGQPVHLLSPLVPSTFLLVGLAGVEFDAHQRKTLGWALGASLVLLLVALLAGVVPWRGAAIPAGMG